MIKALKWKPCAQAKWITSPQIERSLCVRKLVPHAGFRARGCIEGWGAGERLGSPILQTEQGDRRSKDLTVRRKAELGRSNLTECLK